MSVTIAEIRSEDINFNNEHSPDDEAYEISLSENDGKFHLWVNGQLQGIYSTLYILNRVADKYIALHDLRKVA